MLSEDNFLSQRRGAAAVIGVTACLVLTENDLSDWANGCVLLGGDAPPNGNKSARRVLKEMVSTTRPEHSGMTPHKCWSSMKKA